MTFDSFFRLPLLGEGALRATFELGRIETRTDWIAPFVVCLALLLFVLYVYLRDARTLGSVVTFVLTALRIGVFLGLLVIYLQPRWRWEREVVYDSRVLLVVDTSSSMGVADPGADGTPGDRTRAEQVAEALGHSPLLAKLREKHEVVIVGFDEELKRIISFDKLGPEDAAANDAQDSTDAEAGQKEPEIDWLAALAADGLETRLGQTLRQLIHQERNAPISGVILISDGGQNAGPSAEAAILVAQEAHIPVFTVGVGSTRRVGNVRVYKLESMPRIFPGDPSSVTAWIQTQGEDRELAGKSVTVELYLRDGGPDASDGGLTSGTLIGREDVILGAAGESIPVKFEIIPEETGLKTLSVRLLTPTADSDPSDNSSQTEVEIVDRRDRVLLLAGGPTREYRFLRTMLYRDPSVTTEVLLQTATAGISQEADVVLDDFPVTREEMFEYDCLVAFDPNWQDFSEAQINLLETWVAEQGGGMIVVAGPVHTGEPVGGWVQDTTMSKIRALYPVEFHRRSSVWETETYVAEEPWPLDFSREGMEAEFLWLADTETSNLAAWAAFAGVYAHQPVRSEKSGATVFARFSDPRSALGDEQPVFLAEQFYGSGRVFYIGSGEFWRIRRLDTGYFERFYTQVIRHVSQGRMLRQSSRGVLMVGRERYVVGSTVEIRAQLTDAQLAPLEEPSVPLQVIRPDGKLLPIVMRPDPSRLGAYAGQLTVLQEGTFRLELPVPDSGDEVITRRIQVNLPDLERQDPRRNHELLSRIAEGSGGRYYDDLARAVDVEAFDPLVGLLKDRTRTSVLPAAPNLRWEETWMRWAMCVLCSLLCLEWLIRRLWRLA